jgi:glycosyltransferase involved in cell wall biosynthesis
MRLLIVTHYYPSHRGGIEIVAGELARRLARDGITIRWAASDVTDSDGAPGAVPMRACNFAENRLGFPYPVWSPASLSRLRGLIDWCDVVHLHDSLYLGNFLAARLARRARKPVVVTQHIGAVPYRNPLLRGLLQVANHTVARRALTAADACVFISPRVREYFARFVRFRIPPLDLPNGVDTEFFHPATEEERRNLRQRLRWPADKPVFVFAGRFVEKKGLLVLREVARQLPDCEFVFAGWGPLDPRGWGLANVRCPGSLSADELRGYYQAADLLLLPSVGEGFPLVVQEAAACGTPALISTETVAGHDEVRDFAYVAEPDAASVLATLCLLLNERSQLAERRERAADFARRHWNWDRCAKKYQLLFEKLLRSQTQTTPAPLGCNAAIVAGLQTLRG